MLIEIEDLCGEVVELNKSIYEFKQGGIVKINIKEDAHVEIEDAMEEFRLLLSKPEYLPAKALIVPGDNASVSKETRDFANSPQGKSVIKCQAIVVHSLPHKIMANFIRRFYKTPVKIKIFDNEKNAVEWLSAQD
ncbi:hypothetical protein K6119_06335 [Paracrocinitomix mangrovi]|uniref:DUF7793 family protein n=1 Tax=Paracrocinitomix mangrovi TaxID=2862509 RepID=UPI001C8E303F|nr:hypothetical protein [Paracrocinitomix mangrovi]UKN03130.1 hypothetical protein K6119_06335 [Paracrocinitomix mangrovi]